MSRRTSTLVKSLLALLMLSAFAAEAAPTYTLRVVVPGMRSSNVTPAAPVAGWSYASPVVQAFGSTTVGNSATTQKATFTNIQKVAATLAVSSLTGANPADFSVSSACTSVPANQTCDVTFGFTPTQAGTRSASVTIDGTALSLTGTAVAAPTDPLAGNVVLLMHGDGANGATTFADAKGHTGAGLGAARISTASYRFGGASIQLPSAGSLVTVDQAGSADLVSGDFTVEGWIYPTTAGGILIGNYQWQTGYKGGWRLAHTSSGGINFVAGSGATVSSPAGVAPANAWTHIAVTRSGANLYLFANGSQVATLANAATWGAPSLRPDLIRFGAKITDGANYDEQYLGYLDDFRITVGSARYSGSYTVPTQAFPNN